MFRELLSAFYEGLRDPFFLKVQLVMFGLWIAGGLFLFWCTKRQLRANRDLLESSRNIIMESRALIFELIDIIQEPEDVEEISAHGGGEAAVAGLYNQDGNSTEGSYMGDASDGEDDDDVDY